VDVESVKFGRKISEPPFIHTLAAHNLIRDLEDGSVKGKQSEVVRRQEIVNLGEYYQLASSHTSFVAVDYGEVRPRPQIRQKPSNSSVNMTSLVGAIWQYLANPLALFRSPTAGGQPKRGRSHGLPGGWSTPDSADSRAPSESNTEYSDGSEGDDWASEHSDDTLSTLSSLESYSTIDTTPPVRRPQRPSSRHRRDRASSPLAPYTPSVPTGKTGIFKPLPISPKVETLVQQMSASGSFALTDALGAIVGVDVLEAAKSWGDEELAATALALAYLEMNLGDHLEMYQVLAEKGMEFVRNHPNSGKFGEMLDRARTIFQPNVV